MTLTAVWNDPASDHMDLSEAPGSVSFTLSFMHQFQPGESGIIVEAGGSGMGMIIYRVGSDLIAQCGDGATAGSDADTAECRWAVQTGGPVEIVFSADASTGKAALYVDNVLVAQDTFNAANTSGGNLGGVGRVHGGNIAANFAGIGSNDTGAFSSPVPTVRIYAGQPTTEVAS